MFYLTACTGRHCQRWRRYEEELHSSSCLCKHWQLTDRTLAATCRGWQSHRTVLSRSVWEESIFTSLMILFYSVGTYLYVVVVTHVDHPGCITLFEVKQHSRLVQEGEHRHVLNFIKLWRVLGMDVILLMSCSLEIDRVQTVNYCSWPFALLENTIDLIYCFPYTLEEYNSFTISNFYLLIIVLCLPSHTQFQQWLCPHLYCLLVPWRTQPLGQAQSTPSSCQKDESGPPDVPCLTSSDKELLSTTLPSRRPPSWDLRAP